MSTEVHDFRGQGWTERQQVAEGLAVIYWPPGGLVGPEGPLDDQSHYGIEHEHTYPDGTRVLVAPRIDQHRVTGSVQRLTVSPSIACDCALHGFLTDGIWQPV